MYPLWKNRLKFTQLLNETASAHFSSGLYISKDKARRGRGDPVEEEVVEEEEGARQSAKMREGKGREGEGERESSNR